MSCGPLRQAVVLAGGLGTRLGDLTKAVPKPLMPVAGKPFLVHQLDLLAGRGFEEALLLTGHLGDQVEAAVGHDAFGMKVRYSREPAPLGTGGALQLAAPLLDDAFLLCYGDTWLPLDHRAMAEAWASRRPLAMLSAHTGEGTDVPRNLVVASDGRVLAYEKARRHPRANAVEAGTTVLRKEALRFLPAKAPSSLEEVVWPELARRNELRAFWTTERFYDIGTPERLEAIRRDLDAKGEGRTGERRTAKGEEA